MKSIQSRLLATWAVCAAAGMLAGPAVARDRKSVV